jgi:hypothetical protein
LAIFWINAALRRVLGFLWYPLKPLFGDWRRGPSNIFGKGGFYWAYALLPLLVDALNISRAFIWRGLMNFLINAA